MYFNALRDEVAWNQEPIRMFGKWIQQPRLTALYGNSAKTYKYSGLAMTLHPWSDTLLQIKKKIESAAQQEFNTVLLNLYRDGSDSMSWHSDDESTLGKNPVIASLSFGACRNFKFRHRKDKKKVVNIALDDGSLLLMKGTTQHDWEHALPKSRRILGPRINLTFRWVE